MAPWLPARCLFSVAAFCDRRWTPPKPFRSLHFSLPSTHPPCTPCPALRSPSGKEFLWSEFTWANRISGNSTNGTYQIQFELPQYSEEGAWTIDYIELVDKNYNTRFLIPANLTAPQLAASTIQVQGWPRGREQQSFASATAAKGNATIQLSNLSLTYKGTTTPPIDLGTYTVVAFMDHSSTS